MEFQIDDPDLIELYTSGKSRKYKVSDLIARTFAHRIQQLNAAKDIDDLHKIGSLQFKLSNKRNGTDEYTIDVDSGYSLTLFITKNTKHSSTHTVIIKELSRSSQN